MFFTFYSYKGGVGRSMALANIAELLFRQKKRVIIIDWDLEAPGLEGYFFDKSKLEEIISKPGLMDILQTYKVLYPSLALPKETSGNAENDSWLSGIIDNTAKELTNIISNSKKEIEPGKINEFLLERDVYAPVPETVNTIAAELNKKFANQTPELPVITGKLRSMLASEITEPNDQLKEQYKQYLPSILPYLQQIRFDLSSPAKKQPGLWLLSAGMRNKDNFAQYAKLVQEFNWSDFYNSYDGEAFFDWIREELSGFADHILIDSRTGVTEMGGICTQHLSDKVILFTAPNPQNMSGVTKMIRSIQRPEVKKARKERDLQVIVVPARIDNSELPEQNRFKGNFLSDIGEIEGSERAQQFWNLEIPYVPYYTYHDELVAGASSETVASLLGGSTKSEKLERAFKKLAAYMLEEPIKVLPAVQPLNPFIGLRAFDEKDAAFFIGRSLEINRILDAISKQSILIISGPSGSGKTSTLKAGVMPALRERKSITDIRYITIQPGFSLNEFVHVIIPDPEWGRSPFPEAGIPEPLPMRARKIASYIEEYFGNLDRQVVVVIDQVEELYLSEHKEIADIFIQMITNLRKKNSRVAFILSTRSEYLRQIQAGFTQLHEPEPAIINLGTLANNDIRQITTELISKSDLITEQGLLERIITDVEKLSFKLPLIQYTLQKLWINKSGKTLTHEAYDKLGRVDGLFQDFLNENIKTITITDLEEATPILTRLVNVETETRTALRRSDIETSDVLKLKPFMHAGLVTITDNKESGTEMIELTHDILISKWDYLKDRIKKDREFLTWRQRLGYSLQMWEINNRGFLQDYQLKEAEDWMQRRSSELLQKELIFIQQSSVAFNKQKNAPAKSIRAIVNSRLISFVAALALATIVYVIYGYYEKSSNLKQFNTALQELNKKVGKNRQDAICNLAAYNNTSNNENISKAKDSLLDLCVRTRAAFIITQQSIDSSEKIIDTLSARTLIDKGSAANAQKVDSLSYLLNIATIQLASADSKTNTTQLRKDSIQLDSAISGIVKKDPLLNLANAAGNNIEAAVQVQNHTASNNGPDTVFRNSTWFKKGYYLQFENIKVYLEDLSKSNQTITIQVCDFVGPLLCKDPILNPNPIVTLNTPLNFTYGGYNYVINLDRIGSAGKNPFTPAAYISFLKYKK
jgi:MinD-like ATPase involved in chromosome partitioning or flagellar assembly/predicted membrane protein